MMVRSCAIAFYFFTCAIASEHQTCHSASGDGACQAKEVPADVYVGSNLLQQARTNVKLKSSDAPCAELEGKTFVWSCNDDGGERDNDPELCKEHYIERNGEQTLCEPKIKNDVMQLCIASASGSLQSQGVCSATSGCLLPLGDQITQGYVGRTGYRYRLWKQLVDAGIFFDWAGSVTEHADEGWTEDSEPPSQDKLNPDYEGYTFPRQNEGHSEMTTEELASHLGGWLSNYSCQPTCALVDLGTVDMWQKKDVKTTLQDIQAVIDILKDSGSDPTILLAVPTPICGSDDLGYNDLLESIPTLGDADQKIHIVNLDPDGTYSFKNDCFDWCNPNDSGEEKIATEFFKAVKEYC